MDRAWRFNRGRRPESWTCDDRLFNFVSACQQVVEVEDRVQTRAAERQSFLQTNIERSRVREPVAAVWIRANGYGPLVQVRHHDEASERLPVLISRDHS